MNSRYCLGVLIKNRRRDLSIISRIFLSTIILFSSVAFAGWSDNQGKYFGSVLGPTDQDNGDYSLFIPNDFTDYFNQVTAENDNKWGYVEEEEGTINDAQGLQAYQFSVTNNIPFKFHTLLWGRPDQDEGTWREGRDDDAMVNSVINWFEHVRDNYPEVAYIDVVNEVLNEELSYANAFNGRVAADFGKTYSNTISFDCDINADTANEICNIEWVVWAFLKARQVFGPEVKLLINDFQIINGQKSAAYKQIIQKLQSYDYNGQPILDGIGIQTHYFNVSNYGGENPGVIEGVLNDLGDTGLPLHISELDIKYPLSETQPAPGEPQLGQQQQAEYERVLPILWNHPSVVGITLWGYSVGRGWAENTGLVNHNASGNFVSRRPAFDSIENIITGGYPPPNNFGGINPGVNTGRTDENGRPIAHWDVPFTITANACPGGGGTASYVMTFVEDYANEVGTMTILADGSFTATVGPLRPKHGESNMEITRNCPDGNNRTENVPMYVDPSGVVKTVDGEPLIGATVTLYRSDVNTGPFVIVPDGSDIMAPYNRNNPDATRTGGAFGWDVVTGYYKVRAEFPGCVSPVDESQPYVETEIMFIPPEVTDLDIRLKCPSFGSPIKIVKTNDWGSGYCANVVVRNLNSTTLDWDIAFQTEGSIYDFWNADYDQYGNNIYAGGVDWNNLLAPGASTYDVGFCANRDSGSGSGPGSGSYPITVRARGTSGQEVINLTVGGNVVATWNLTTSFQNYSVNTSLGGGINVVYGNDAPNRDVVVDYLTINGVVHQTENQTSNTATWSGSCGAGSFSEWMHCNGYIGFNAFK